MFDSPFLFLFLGGPKEGRGILAFVFYYIFIDFVYTRKWLILFKNSVFRKKALIGYLAYYAVLYLVHQGLFYKSYYNNLT